MHKIIKKVGRLKFWNYNVLRFYYCMRIGKSCSLYLTLISRIYFVIFRANNIKKIDNCQANTEGNENKIYSINQKEAGKKRKKKKNM